MTAYERFQALELDRSWLGLERGDTRGDYFCTPLGAQVIGWAGLDGIHFCFVEGFGEMVFAVSPANLPGDYVQPLAGSFADFIRLVLACGGIDAAEQAHGWSRVQFDEYLAQYPPDGERRAALDALGDGMGLAPMDDPYGYIKGIQSSFDYGALRFGEDYWDFVGRPSPPPQAPAWRVTYGGGRGRRSRWTKPLSGAAASGMSRRCTSAERDWWRIFAWRLSRSRCGSSGRSGGHGWRRAGPSPRRRVTGRRRTTPWA